MVLEQEFPLESEVILILFLGDIHGYQTLDLFARSGIPVSVSGRVGEMPRETRGGRPEANKIQTKCVFFFSCHFFMTDY